MSAFTVLLSPCPACGETHDVVASPRPDFRGAPYDWPLRAECSRTGIVLRAILRGRTASGYQIDAELERPA